MAELKKKIRPGLIELHGEESAIIAHYELQEVLQCPDGSQEVTSSSQATKKITVKSLNERTDLPALAAEIVDKCKLIHPSKVGFIQSLLVQLQQRQLAQQPALQLDATAAVRPSSAHAAAPAGALDAATASGSSSRAGTPTRVTATAAGGAGGGGGGAAAAARPSSAASSRPASASSRPGSASHSARGVKSAQQHSTGEGQQTVCSSSSSHSSSPTRLGRQQQQQQQRDAENEVAMLAEQQQQQQLTQRVLVQTSDIMQGLWRSQQSPPAFMDDLESYIEGLYEEDLTARAAAAGMMCQLFRSVDRFEVLLGRETLLSTLARLLREDGIKSLELATAVAGCFFACSCLQQLHRLLLDNQVGTLLMDLISLELQRSAAREAEGPGGSAAAITARAAAAAAAAAGGAGSGSSGSSSSRAPPLDERESRLLSVVVRQDRFLYVATATLLHLADDVAVQKKMRKKDIVGVLVGLLNRPHMELLLLVTGFLRRLCVYAENKDRLGSLPGVIPQLLPLTQPGCGELLQTSALRLLHNLCFDAGLRQQMVQGGLVPQAVQLLDSPHTAPLAAGLLYQLSLDDAAKSLFVFCPGALPRLHESIMRAMGAGFAGTLAAAGGSGGDLRSVPELIALAVNLAHSKRTAEWFCVGERLERLLRRSLATADELAWKLLHNLAVSGGQEVGRRLLGLSGGMMDLLQSPNTGPELFAEVLGTLAAACDALSNTGSSSSNNSGGGDGSSADVAGSGSSMMSGAPADAAGAGAGARGVCLSHLVVIEDLLALLRACLVPGALEDDALLESVVLLGALCGQEDFDAHIADSSLLDSLVDLMAEKRADDEFVLQVCWAFSRCLMQPASSAALLEHQQVVPYLVDLLQDSCGPVRRVAGACLDVIMDNQTHMAGTIRSLKFESHNQEWLSMAGPDAQHILAAAAAAAAGGSGTSRDWQQQQQHAVSSPRRNATSGYATDLLHQQHQDYAEAQQMLLLQQQQQQQGGNDYFSFAGEQQAVQRQQASREGMQYDGSQQAMMHWMMTGAGGPAGGVEAAGQRMVLDLDEFVGGQQEQEEEYGQSQQQHQENEATFYLQQQQQQVFAAA